MLAYEHDSDQYRIFHSGKVWLYCFNISVYVKDARAQVLPLLGGEGVIHDWNYILWSLHMLNWDQVVGKLIYTAGLLVLGMSIVGGFYASTEKTP